MSSPVFISQLELHNTMNKNVHFKVLHWTFNAFYKVVTKQKEENGKIWFSVYLCSFTGAPNAQWCK